MVNMQSTLWDIKSKTETHKIDITESPRMSIGSLCTRKDLNVGKPSQNWPMPGITGENQPESRLISGKPVEIYLIIAYSGLNRKNQRNPLRHDENGLFSAQS
jgi:hypothetical protein